MCRGRRERKGQKSAQKAKLTEHDQREPPDKDAHPYRPDLEAAGADDEADRGEDLEEGRGVVGLIHPHERRINVKISNTVDGNAKLLLLAGDLLLNVERDDADKELLGNEVVEDLDDLLTGEGRELLEIRLGLEAAVHERINEVLADKDVDALAVLDDDAIDPLKAALRAEPVGEGEILGRRCLDGRRGSER